MSIEEEKDQLPARRRPRATLTDAYLVRCWQDGDAVRYSLQKVGNERSRAFEDVAMLLSVLKAALQGGPRNEP